MTIEFKVQNEYHYFGSSGCSAEAARIDAIGNTELADEVAALFQRWLNLPNHQERLDLDEPLENSERKALRMRREFFRAIKRYLSGCSLDARRSA